MNFSAGKAGRKWPCRGSPCGEWPTLAAGAVLLLMLCASADPAAARKPDRGLWSDLFGQGRPRLRGALLPASVPLPRPRPSDAPSHEADKPAAGQQARLQPNRLSRAPRAALGLPAGADGCDCDRAQHSRYPRRRRLRRRGSGAAGSRGAAGQAAGFAETRSHPTLHHGLGGGGLDPHRHGAAGGKPRQHHQRSRQFRLVRMPRPQPRGRRSIVRAWPGQRARRPLVENGQWPIDCADRPQCAARGAREACCIRYARGSRPCWGRVRTAITKTTSTSI